MKENLPRQLIKIQNQIRKNEDKKYGGSRDSKIAPGA